MPKVQTNKFRPIQTPYGRKAPGERFVCTDREAQEWVARNMVELVPPAADGDPSPPKPRRRRPFSQQRRADPDAAVARDPLS